MKAAAEAKIQKENQEKAAKEKAVAEAKAKQDAEKQAAALKLQ